MIEQTASPPHELDRRIPDASPPGNIEDFVAIRRQEQQEAQELLTFLAALGFVAFVAYLFSVVM